MTPREETDQTAKLHAIAARYGIAPIAFSVIGREHFGNPIPQAWYTSVVALFDTIGVPLSSGGVAVVSFSQGYAADHLGIDPYAFERVGREFFAGDLSRWEAAMASLFQAIYDAQAARGA